MRDDRGLSASAVWIGRLPRGIELGANPTRCATVTCSKGSTGSDAVTVAAIETSEAAAGGRGVANETADIAAPMTTAIDVHARAGVPRETTRAQSDLSQEIAANLLTTVSPREIARG